MEAVGQQGKRTDRQISHE